ncbi:MAG: glycosyltransferase [Flavobacteriaceae bacterium]|nr:glycosyltransferase [Flavobacteriaceae bacterium]
MNSDNPEIHVSICVQTYNHQNFIAECLDSILMQQTTFPFEIILGEDKSSDDTRRICKEYAEKHPSKIKLSLRSRDDVVYMFGKPTGRYNMIKNLEISSGKYIAICEGDDYWTDPLKLQKQIDFLEKTPKAVGSFHNSVCVDKDSEIIEKQYFKDTDKLFYTQEECLKSLHSSYSTGSLVFRANAIKNRLDDFSKIGSDFILDILITNDGELCYMDENMSAYRIHSGGIWQGNTSIHNQKVIIERYMFLYDNEKYRKKYNGYLWNTIINRFEKLITEIDDIKEKQFVKKQRLKFLNFFDSRSYLFFLKKIERSIHYRIKRIKNRF